MRVALTGGSTGIGAAVAAKLRARGDEVIAFDLNKPGYNVDQWIEIDLSNPALIAAAANGIDGPFDALINNAGIPPREGLAEAVLNINYFGLRQFTEAMLDKMESGGSIVNTASRAGSMWRDNIEEVKALMALKGGADLPGFIAERKIDHVRAYNLSKEAVIVQSMVDTEHLIARGLRINSVSPAAVSTGILDDFKAAFGERVNKAIARVGRAGTADEIADAIIFLTSPASHWIKGQDITIDGGMSALAMSDVFSLS